MMNEPIDFVKKAMVCGHDIYESYSSQHILIMVVQRDGTAIPSLAREQLLEAESLDGPEAQRQEEVVKRVLGSMYIGESF